MAENTMNARTTVKAIDLNRDKVDRANRQREKKKKPLLSYSRGYEAAVKAVKIKDLVNA